MGHDRRSRWTIASARQNLPTLVDLAVHEPQAIYRRDTLVARVVGPDTEPETQVQGPKADELLTELHRVCSDEGYELPVPRRRDRPNAFVATGPHPPRPVRNRKPAKQGR